MRFGIIYQQEFPNGKSYIGLTTKSLEQRTAQHRAASRSDKNSPLCNAWRKFGEPKISVIDKVPLSYLNICEEYYIAINRTQAPYGYNITPGGNASPALVLEVAAKISKSKTGKSFSISHCHNLSIAHQGLPSPKKGKPMSEDQKAKLKAAWVHRRLKPDSAETREKKAASRRGKKMAASSRAKVSAARLAYWEAKRLQDVIPS